MQNEWSFPPLRSVPPWRAEEQLKVLPSQPYTYLLHDLIFVHEKSFLELVVCDRCLYFNTFHS
jgi:hypothetical protein